MQTLKVGQRYHYYSYEKPDFNNYFLCEVLKIENDNKVKLRVFKASKGWNICVFNDRLHSSYHLLPNQNSPEIN